MKDGIKSRAKPQPTRAAQLQSALEVVVYVGIFAGLLMPLVLARVIIYPFVYPKILYFQLLVGLTFPAWVSLALQDARYRPKPTRLFWSILAWFGAMTLATCFAVNPWRSLFSYPERMTGLFTSLHFLAWYLMASSMLRTSRAWRWLLEAQLGVGFVSAAVAILQLKYPGLMGVGEVAAGERLSGLLGNPIYLGAYEGFSVFFTLYLWQGASLWRKACYVVAVVAALWAIVLAGSRGPMLGIAVGLLVGAVIVALTSRNRRLAASTAVAAPTVAVAYGLFVGFVANRPSLKDFWASHSNLQHLFQFEIDLPRVRLWSAAWDGFLSKPILGWGPNGYELAFDALFKPTYHALGISDEAHNTVLGVMCETGLVGLGAFLFMWGGFVAASLKAMKREALSHWQGAALIAAGTAHFVQNLFAFDSAATQLTTLMAFAVATAAIASVEHPNSETPETSPVSLRKRIPFGAIPAFMFGVVVVGTVLPFFASYYAKQSTALMQQRNKDGALDLIRTASKLATPYRDDQLVIVTGMARNLVRSKQLETWPQRDAFLTVMKDIAGSYFAHNSGQARLRRLYADTLVVVGRAHDKEAMFKEAEALYKKNIAESPQRQVNRFAYAAFLSDAGRQKEAEEQYRLALAADTSIGEANWLLGRFLWADLQQIDEGSKLMAKSAEGVDRYYPTRALEWTQLGQAIAKQGQVEKLRELVAAVRSFPKGDQPPNSHLEIARFMELFGLFAERDEVLRLVRERHPNTAAIVDAVLTGKRQLLAPRAGADSQPREFKTTQAATTNMSVQPPRGAP